LLLLLLLDAEEDAEEKSPSQSWPKLLLASSVLMVIASGSCFTVLGAAEVAAWR